MEIKRVIAVLDLPPRQAPENVRESYAVAAERWGAELHWIRSDLQPVHPFWQKMFVCDHVHRQFGPSQVLQLDNDMVIRSDCPSPFALLGAKQFGIVAERQCALTYRLCFAKHAAGSRSANTGRTRPMPSVFAKYAH